MSYGLGASIFPHEPPAPFLATFRGVEPRGLLLAHAWCPVGVTVLRGASIGGPERDTSSRRVAGLETGEAGRST